jgi:hypothetical protein
LHPEDPLRSDYGSEEPPPPRTHLQACEEAKVSETMPYARWDAANHPRLATGINHWSPLSILRFFDMIWDFCPDLMHVIKTFFERLLIGVFSGSRKPTNFKRKVPAKPNSRATTTEREEYKVKKRKYDSTKREFEDAVQAFDESKFDTDAQKIVDERVKNLVGYPNWLKTTLVQSQKYLTKNLRIYIQTQKILAYFTRIFNVY